jgi:DNA-binding MarR family transcriptional regulator
MVNSRSTPYSLRDEAGAALGSDLAWHARLVARLFGAAYDHALAPSGLTSAQFGLMCLIASAPDDTIGALALQCGLNQSTMSRNVEQLVRAGLVELVTQARDRRQRAVWLTEQGARRLQQALPAWRAAQRDLMRTLDAQLIDHLVGVATVLVQQQGLSGR